MGLRAASPAQSCQPVSTNLATPDDFVRPALQSELDRASGASFHVLTDAAGVGASHMEQPNAMKRGRSRTRQLARASSRQPAASRFASEQAKLWRTPDVRKQGTERDDELEGRFGKATGHPFNVVA